MAEVPSTFILKPGDLAPDFSLPDASGAGQRYEAVAGAKGTVVAFVCNHCPYVVHLAGALGRFAGEMAVKGVATVAISSNDVTKYPADAPDKMKEFARDHGWQFPYLYDESQETARAYAAACTPDFFLFDGERRLFYAGQFDDTRPGSDAQPGGADLRAAVDAMLTGEATAARSIPSTGCNIKWKPGNEPAWF